MTPEELSLSKARVYDLLVQRDALHLEMNQLTEPYGLKIQKINQEIDSINLQIKTAIVIQSEVSS